MNKNIFFQAFFFIFIVHKNISCHNLRKKPPKEYFQKEFSIKYWQRERLADRLPKINEDEIKQKNGRYTERFKKKILSFLEEGFNQTSLIKAYGISRETISRWMKQKKSKLIVYMPVKNKEVSLYIIFNKLIQKNGFLEFKATQRILKKKILL